MPDINPYVNTAGWSLIVYTQNGNSWDTQSLGPSDALPLPTDGNVRNIWDPQNNVLKAWGNKYFNPSQNNSAWVLPDRERAGDFDQVNVIVVNNSDRDLTLGNKMIPANRTTGLNLPLGIISLSNGNNGTRQFQIHPYPDQIVVVHPNMSAKVASREGSSVTRGTITVHNCYNMNMIIKQRPSLGSSGQNLGSVQPNRECTLQARAGYQVYLQSSSGNVISGCATISSGNNGRIYFRTDGTTSSISCDSGLGMNSGTSYGQKMGNNMMGNNMMGNQKMGCNMTGNNMMGNNMMGNQKMGCNMTGNNMMGNQKMGCNMMGNNMMENNMMGCQGQMMNGTKYGKMMGTNMMNDQMMNGQMMNGTMMDGQMMNGTMMDCVGAVTDLLMQNSNFSTFVSALNRAGFLGPNGPSLNQVTIFVPTNQAFAKLPAGTLQSWLNNPNLLRQILLLHVVNEVLPSSQLVQRSSVISVEGATWTIRTSNGKVFIGQAEVIQPDLQACNGVIHAIDQVLMLPSMMPSKMTTPTGVGATQMTNGVTQTTSGCNGNMVGATPSGCNGNNTATSASQPGKTAVTRTNNGRTTVTRTTGNGCNGTATVTRTVPPASRSNQPPVTNGTNDWWWIILIVVIVIIIIIILLIWWWWDSSRREAALKQTLLQQPLVPPAGLAAAQPGVVQYAPPAQLGEIVKRPPSTL